MSVDAGPIPSRHERPDRTRYPPVATDTARNAGPKATVAVRSVLIHDQRAAAREALTHAVTAAIPSVTHIACVADASHLSAAFAGTPADLVFIALQGATAGTVHAVKLFLQRYPSASVIVLGGVDDTPVLAAADAHGAQGLMLWPPWYGRTPVRGFPVGARGGVPALTRVQQAVLQGMSQGRSNREIADTLGVTEDTVKSHAAHLYRQLGARDRAHAVALGLRHRLVS